MGDRETKESTMLKVKVSSLSGTRRKIEVEVPKERVAPELERIYQKIQKAALLPGFRQGKVPRNLLTQNFGGHAREELLRDLLPVSVEEAVKEAGLDAISIPEVSQIQFLPDGAVSFQAEFDIRPEIKLKSYRGIKLTKPVFGVTEEEIDDVLKRIQLQHAEFQVVEGRSAREGDYLVCEVRRGANGKTPQKQERVWLSLDKNQDSEKIVEQLIGIQTGEKREIKAAVKENEMVDYEVSVHEIKERHLPALDDAFAKNSNFETLSALREDISLKLSQEKENRSKRELETELLDRLVEQAKLELPQSVIKAQADRLVQNTKTRLLTQGFRKSQLEDQESSIRQRVEPQAERQVKIHFILEEIARRENIAVSEEEVSHRIEEIAGKTNQPAEAVDRYFEQKNLYSGLMDELTQEKTIEFLLKEAKIK